MGAEGGSAVCTWSGFLSRCGYGCGAEYEYEYEYEYEIGRTGRWSLELRAERPQRLGERRKTRGDVRLRHHRLLAAAQPQDRAGHRDAMIVLRIHRPPLHLGPGRALH